MSSIIGTVVTSILNSMRPPMSALDLEIKLNELAQRNPERLDWRNSIVDLLKLLKMDHSLEARSRLAKELRYKGEQKDGSAEKNIWLHKAVMAAVAERIFKVPV